MIPALGVLVLQDNHLFCRRPRVRIPVRPHLSFLSSFCDPAPSFAFWNIMLMQGSWHTINILNSGRKRDFCRMCFFVCILWCDYSVLAGLQFALLSFYTCIPLKSTGMLNHYHVKAFFNRPMKDLSSRRFVSSINSLSSRRSFSSLASLACRLLTRDASFRAFLSAAIRRKCSLISSS